MRYIKLFEDVNDYYFEISYNEYDITISPFDSVNLTESEKKLIQNQISYSYDMYTYYNNRSMINIQNKYNDILFCISKRTDDWYFIEKADGDYNSSYYKCDQIDGVIELLKNQGVIQ